MWCAWCAWIKIAWNMEHGNNGSKGNVDDKELKEKALSICCVLFLQLTIWETEKRRYQLVVACCVGRHGEGKGGKVVGGDFGTTYFFSSSHLLLILHTWYVGTTIYEVCPQCILQWDCETSRMVGFGWLGRRRGVPDCSSGGHA